MPPSAQAVQAQQAGAAVQTVHPSAVSVGAVCLSPLLHHGQGLAVLHVPWVHLAGNLIFVLYDVGLSRLIALVMARMPGRRR